MNTQSVLFNGQVAFIDAGVADSASLVSQFKPGTEVHLLDSSQDAIAQIAQVLTSRSNISAVHLVSHGSNGALQLGGDSISDLSDYATELKLWSNSLTADADILLYGCNVAANATGKTFVNQLAQLTGADVTASDDLTGSAALGGDWELEYQTGSIETSSIDATDYSSTLANFTVTTLTDIVNPNDGVISLREAVNTANTLGGSNNIFFGVNGTFTLGGSELTISSNLNIYGNGAPFTTISGNNASRVFNVSGSTVLLSGLTITNGQVPGPNEGGGIFNSGNLTVQFCTLSGNSASYGGGIRNVGSLTINRSTLSGNSVFQFGSGGGIRNTGSLTINRSTLSGNSAFGGFGGGIDNQGGLTVTSSTFSGNSAVGGGGISNGGGLTVTSSTFTGNSATGGGGIYNAVTATLIGNVISQNSATNAGGGVFNDNRSGSTVKLQLNNISSNTAPSGPDLFRVFVSGNSPTNPFGFNVIGRGGGFSGIVNGVNGDVILAPGQELPQP